MHFSNWEVTIFEGIFSFYIDRNLFMQIWSVNYSLHCENVKILKHCLYWKVFSTDMYIYIYICIYIYIYIYKDLFQQFAAFLAYLLVGKLYELSQ